jgi:hypothetical protein
MKDLKLVANSNLSCTDTVPFLVSDNELHIPASVKNELTERDIRYASGLVALAISFPTEMVELFKRTPAQIPFLRTALLNALKGHIDAAFFTVSTSQRPYGATITQIVGRASISFSKNKALIGYFKVWPSKSECTVKSQREGDFVVDMDGHGFLYGVEILSPATLSVPDLESLLKKHHVLLTDEERKFLTKPKLKVEKPKAAKVTVESLAVVCPYCSHPLSGYKGSQMWLPCDLKKAKEQLCTSCGKMVKIPAKTVVRLD